jgi:peptide/nickel transport system substrate-binding protein
MSEDSVPTLSRRSTVKALSGGAATVALAGCTSTETSPTTTGGGGDQTSAEPTTDAEAGEFAVTITQGATPTTLDPHDNRSTTTDTVLLQAYEALLRRDAQGDIKPELAKDWERIEPGRFRFYIREGPTFQQTGNELTTEDVAYSINRVVKPSVGFKSPQASQLAGITGAEVVDGKRAVDLLSDGLNPLMPRQIPNNGQVMEKAWVKDHEKSYIAKHINGTGPFRLADYEPDVRAVFERYNDYWQEPAAVSRVTFTGAKEPSVRVNQLVEGETDIAVNVPPQSVSRVESSDRASINPVPSTRVIYNAMKATTEPFTSPKFRRAMNYAIDLKSIVQDVLSGFGDPTDQPTLEGFYGYNQEVSRYPQDLEKAERLVEESGFAGASITLHTPVGRYLKDVQIAQAVVEMIDQLPNVSAELKQREFGALAAKLVDGDITTGPDFYLIGWGNPQLDASQTLIPTLTSSGTLTSWKNEEFDSLVNRAQNTSGEERKNLLERANGMAHDQAPWIFLNRQYSVYGVSSRISWQPRRDERIDAYAIKPAQ